MWIDVDFFTLVFWRVKEKILAPRAQFLVKGLLVYVHVEEKRCQYRSNPSQKHFLSIVSLLLGPVALMRVKLRLRKNTMKKFIMCLSKTNCNSFACEVAVPHDVIRCCKVNKPRASLLFGQETIFNFTGEESNLILSRSNCWKPICS